MTKVDKSCSECGICMGTYSNVYMRYICKTCRCLDKYTSVTKTNAKKNYLLRDDDLLNLQCSKGRSSYGEATYYNKKEIKKYLSSKLNIEYDEIDRYIKKIIDEKKMLKNLRSEKREKKRMEDKNRRRILLEEELGKYKLKLRSDSVLCKNYINGDKEYNIDDIVRRMCEMKYLYDYCEMDKCRDEAYKNYIDEMNNGYIPDMRVCEMAEIIALDKYSNGKYPEKFPWL